MQEELDLLAAMPVFGGLSDSSLALLVDKSRLVELDEGEHFFLEGETTQVMYVLQSGRVKIYKSWHGEFKLLRWMERGDCFGEMALVDLFPRSASALAAEPCTAMALSAGVLQKLHAHDAEQFTMLQMNIGREVTRRLRRVDDLLFRALMGESLPETTFEDYS